MAVGLITEPSTWVNGVNADSTWFENVQDTINALYGGFTLARTVWVGPTLAAPPTTSPGWGFVFGTGAAWVRLGSGGDTLGVILSAGLFSFDAVGANPVVSAVGISVFQSSGAAIDAEVFKTINQSNTSAGPSTTSLGTFSTAGGSGKKFVGLTGLTAEVDDDTTFHLEISSAVPNDVFYAARVTLSYL